LGRLNYFDMIAAGFTAVAVLNLLLWRQKGSRALGLAAASAAFAVASYLWQRDETGLPKWLAAAGVGLFLATVLYESAKRKIEPK
jgi:hypothetical protein